MPERSGEPNRLLVMVLMVMGVPLVRWLAATRRPRLHYTLWVSLEVNLFGPPLGLLDSSVEILGEGGNEGIGQCDHFVMVKFLVLIGQNDYSLELLAVGRQEANLGETHTRVRLGCNSRCQYATGRVYQPWSFLCPYSPECVEGEFSEVRSKSKVYFWITDFAG